MNSERQFALTELLLALSSPMNFLAGHNFTIHDTMYNRFTNKLLRWSKILISRASITIYPISINENALKHRPLRLLPLDIWDTATIKQTDLIFRANMFRNDC
ncbi:hypothetical protein BJ878DRAFT_530034 [Calycina marina]|uniref:Uncharacterized protein n=1 Tax=Calycina marina TaxID=1763456 RepID=A0A9P8CAT9_9HELO|nr:hypothetical protein BJ878DRAFT_530034 [Calycina marina]